MIELFMLQSIAAEIEHLAIPCEIQNGEAYGLLLQERRDRTSPFTWVEDRCVWSEDANQLAESILGSFEDADRVYAISVLPGHNLPEHHVIFVDQNSHNAVIASLFLRANYTRLGHANIAYSPQITMLRRTLSTDELQAIDQSARAVGVCNTPPNGVVNQDAASWTYEIWTANTHCSVQLFDPLGPFAHFGEMIAEFGNDMLDSYVSDLLERE